MNVFDYTRSCAQRLKKVYSDYAKSTTDEGLRKFLLSMSEQESSHLQLLSEKLNELSGRKEVIAEAQRLGSDISGCREQKNVADLERVDFFSYAMGLEEETMNTYKKIYENCEPNGELSSLFHSLYEEEKRHYALVKDRYELESLL